MVLSYKERSQKLRTVSEALGFDHPLTLLFNYLNEPTVPGICINAGYSLIQNVAPQEEHGHCANCNTCTVQSVLVLAGVE